MSTHDESNDAERVPCPDDMCTGTINEAGACSYCGRSASGAPPSSGVALHEVHTDVDELAPTAACGAVSDDGERVPCADDMCTGTLNLGGVCNYCGKRGRA